MREKAMLVLKQYNKNEALIRHAIAVEAVMRYFAAQAGEDVDYWGAVGFLHDVDYEMYPDQHCKKAPEILRSAGYDDAFIHAVISHGHGLVCLLYTSSLIIFLSTRPSKKSTAPLGPLPLPI